MRVHFSDPAGYQDSARRAKMGSQSFRGRGEWELFFFYRYTVYNLFSLWKTHSYRSLTHSHTLGLETVKNHPTDFEMCCCSPSLSANMRSLALCLAHKEAYTSLVVGVIFKGFLLPCSCQNESWKYLFYIISSHLFVLFVGTS